METVSYGKQVMRMKWKWSFKELSSIVNLFILSTKTLHFDDDCDDCDPPLADRRY